MGRRQVGITLGMETLRAVILLAHSVALTPVLLGAILESCLKTDGTGEGYAPLRAPHQSVPQLGVKVKRVITPTTNVTAAVVAKPCSQLGWGLPPPTSIPIAIKAPPYHERAKGSHIPRVPGIVSFTVLLAVCISQIPLIRFEEVLLCLVECFYHEGLLGFIKCLFCIYSNNCVVFVLYCINLVYYIDFKMLNNSCCFMINTTQSWYIIPLCMLLDLVCRYFVKDFNIGIHNGHRYVVSLCFFSLVLVKVILALQNELRSITSSYFFGRVCK